MMILRLIWGNLSYQLDKMNSHNPAEDKLGTGPLLGVKVI